MLVQRTFSSLPLSQLRTIWYAWDDDEGDDDDDANDDRREKAREEAEVGELSRIIEENELESMRFILLVLAPKTNDSKVCMWDYGPQSAASDI